jgi:virginiamycin B lyase
MSTLTPGQRYWRASAMQRLSGLAFVATALAGTLHAQSFTEYPAGGDPFGITAGPDGNLWFTEMNANKIGRITLEGAVTEFSIPTAASGPQSIAKGSDGNLWFSEDQGAKIGRITTSGVVTEFGLTDPSSTPSSIVPGPDGALWFTEYATNKIGRITTAGTVTEFDAPFGPASIAAGADGNLWFTERLGNHVARITPAGSITPFTTQTMSRLTAITAAADGNLWFLSDSDAKIGRITTGGNVSEFAIPDALVGALSVAAGPDGNVWTTGDHAIARITTSGVATVYDVPESGGQVPTIVTGQDGSLWFTETDSKVGKFSLGLCTPSDTSLCLSGGRFQVRASWTVPASSTSGQGTAISLTGDTGYFWFFSPGNVEMVVKVLDACALNSKYWVFAGGLTSVGVTMTVTDMQTSVSKTYQNPANTAFVPIQDTSAFSTCP